MSRFRQRWKNWAEPALSLLAVVPLPSVVWGGKDETLLIIKD